jgi:hypothetical protein
MSVNKVPAEVARSARQGLLGFERPCALQSARDGALPCTCPCIQPLRRVVQPLLPC